MNKKSLLWKGLGKKMNKHAGEKLLSIWWIFVLGVIGGGIVVGELIYYSVNVNVNAVEAEMLNNRIYNCISENGILKKGVINGEFDIFTNCNINRNLFFSGSVYYIHLKFSNNTGILNESSFGQGSFEGDCLVQTKVTANNFPKCYKNEGFFSYGEDKIQFYLLTGSNQQGKEGII